MDLDAANLIQCPLFRGLDLDELPGLLRRLHARTRRADRGEVVLRAGEVPGELGVVLSGTLHVVRDDLWGDRAILSQLRAGDLFAEVYALLGEPLQVTVEARESSQVLFFSVRRMREDVPQRGERLELVLARKNLALNRKLGYLTLPTTREKALAYLSDESRRQGSGTFSIPFDRQELADYLSVDRSALSAVLGALRREGLISFQKNQFTLHRQEDLR